jgi:ectoine hydroxylase-related dioxygenase (phytanoyl-CoA dioxygenase family)
VLGEDFQLSNFTTVVSNPGAPIQHIHRDSEHLFPGHSFGPDLLVYEVNPAVPLIDVDLRTGPTAVWLGSHRWPGTVADVKTMTASPLQRGDCMMLDYRTLHAGLMPGGRRGRSSTWSMRARGTSTR